MRLRPSLVCLLVLTAGCATAPADTPTAAPGGTPPAGSPADTSRETETAGTTAPTTNLTDTPTCNVEPLTASVEIAFHAETPVSVTVVEAETRVVVLNGTYPGSAERVEFGEEGDVFEPATDYRVTIRANDSVQWNRTVRRNREYELDVRQNGSVELLQPAAIVESATPCPS